MKFTSIFFTVAENNLYFVFFTAMRIWADTSVCPYGNGKTNRNEL